MKEKVIVIGATGYIGSSLCKELHKENYAVYAVAFEKEYDHIQKYIESYISLDLTNEENTQSLVDFLCETDPRNVIIAVGAVNYTHNLKTSWQMNVIPIENILTAMRKAGNLKYKRILFLGSVASHGFNTLKNKENLITEKYDTFQKGRSIYCDVKRKATQLFQQLIDEGFPGIIIEPGSLVGESLGGRETTNSGLIQKILKGYPVLSGGASYISLAVLIKGISSCLKKGKVGETYILGGENLTMKEFALVVNKVYSDKYHQKKIKQSVIVLPRFISSVLGFFNLVINKQQALLGSSFHYIDNSKATNDFNYEHSNNDIVTAIKSSI